MRRGLISWSREELPAAALDARVSRLQAGMRAQGLGAVLAYASFAQPAPVQWLCNFIPYWSEALLVVQPEGPPTLLVALTPRVHFWIREVSHVGELVAAPKPGAQAAQLLAQSLPSEARVGVIGLDALPWSVAEPLLAAGWGPRLVDATALYQAARHPADDAELALARKAAAMAQAALDATPAEAARSAEVIAAADGSARLAGAEEVLPRIAPDLAADATLRRMEGVQVLGERYAVDCSLAYRGVWVRMARSVCRSSAAPASWAAADAWFDAALAGWTGSGTPDLAANAPGRLADWTLEASTGLAPLSVAASGPAPQGGGSAALPAGTLAVFSARLEMDDGPWLRSAPLRIGHGALAT
ncbi:aminopeptidase P family N-terminal domain-containing protein [Ramlibacter sp. AW1]|uniref:Aminopeptidase P family N-terminal domain-containing protein n=1 Tax=Ramlibacter aurantiacus TaxID=2801330 RepID=A0A936ZM36_9BURK|nr:aminopeptidase P family N-terminal domain-containing protein [Ramlibacter aurantiacus]MBL0422698.1 aminopeptidase P family N-terminal domain-containing protein [Ramlibacter aurantiacus]